MLELQVGATFEAEELEDADEDRDLGLGCVEEEEDEEEEEDPEAEESINSNSPASGSELRTLSVDGEPWVGILRVSGVTGGGVACGMLSASWKGMSCGLYIAVK
jgi:hypothetical protein